MISEQIAVHKALHLFQKWIEGIWGPEFGHSIRSVSSVRTWSDCCDCRVCWGAGTGGTGGTGTPSLSVVQIDTVCCAVQWALQIFTGTGEKWHLPGARCALGPGPGLSKNGNKIERLERRKKHQKEKRLAQRACKFATCFCLKAVHEERKINGQRASADSYMITFISGSDPAKTDCAKNLSLNFPNNLANGYIFWKACIKICLFVDLTHSTRKSFRFGWNSKLWFSLSLGPRPWWTFSRTWTMNKPTSKSPSKTFSVKMSANQGWRLCLVTQAETQTIQSLQIVKKKQPKVNLFCKKMRTMCRVV